MFPRNHNGVSDSHVTITFEHCHNARPDIASGSSSPANSSYPATPTEQLPGSPLDASDPSEDSWNLIPYDVPWGPDYYHYQRGTLPGPDGACIFLRSPTPLKNKRTQRACNKCRQRKAKCSGGRPACGRCLARGYICEYDDEDEKPPVHTSRPSCTQRTRAPSESSDEMEASSPEADYHPGPPVESYAFAPSPIKLEEPDFGTDLHYFDNFDSPHMTPLNAQPHSAWPDAHYEQEAMYHSNCPSDSSSNTSGTMEYYDPPPYPVDAEMSSYQPSDMPSVYDPHASHPAAVHAPRPVRCVGSPSFLAAEERPPHFSSCATQVSQHDDMLISYAAVAEPTSHIALPHVPPMPSADLVAVHDGAFQYAYEQPVYYSPAPVPQYPVLQYQYNLSAYMPGPQENVDAATYYSLVATGMVS